MPLRDRPTALERVLVAEEVASTLRHDLRNKLAAVRQAATYLARRIEKTETWTSEARVPRFFALMETELAAADALVSDQTTRPQFERQSHRFDLNQWLGTALDTAALPPGVQLAHVLHGHAPVEVDPRDLWVALECVLENAVEAMPEGGEVRVVTVLTSDRVIVRITDTGEGMPAQPGVPFKSGKVGHAGIGLRLARRAAARCGGAMTIESAPTGTQVDIVLVRAPGPPVVA